MAICGYRNWRSDFLGVVSIIGVLAHVIFCSENHALAQIIPDRTLGNNSSRITPNVNIKGLPADRIDGGAIRGANLFQSFQEFNVGKLQRVYFANPTGISNILTRVTGSNVSNILGTLGVDGSANLFFLNPNGIIFGQNARLDVSGSFIATTANSFVFGNGLEFSATNPQTPSALLTVNPSALFFNQIEAGSIENRSIAPAGIDPTGLNAYGLRVADGKSLLLVGGNVSTDGGKLNAYGGRVELGGLAAPGNVNLVFNRDNLSLKFPLNVTRADVSLTNEARVYVEAAGGGDIAINARNVDILGSSDLYSGIGWGLGTPETVAGDITLNATGDIKIAGSGSLAISNSVDPRGVGKGGNIDINATSLSLTDGAELDNSTFGQGNAGNVTVGAKNAVSLTDSVISSTVVAGGVGNGGNIDINAATLSLTNSGLFTSTFGQGNAGNVTVGAKNAVSITDSGIYSTVEAGGIGNGGNIDINAATLSLTNSGLFTSTFGQGNGGNVTVSAKNAVSIAGTYIYSTVEAGGIGNGGNIDINAATLLLTHGAELDTETAGQGNAGNIGINAKDAVTVSGTFEGGISRGLTFIGYSGLFTFTESTSTGKSGNITVNTNIFRISDGDLLDAHTANNQKGGDITVNANIFDALNGGQLTTATSSNGGAGKITVNADDKLTISGIDPSYSDRITRFPYDLGNMGANSGLFVSSKGSGITGDIEINSPKITLDNQGKLNAESASGNGGNINVINSDLLLLRHGAQISTNAGTAEKGGDGGNININSRFIVAVPKENSDISANAFTGIGGRVDITTNGIFGIVPQKSPTENSDITASSQLGVSGEVTINSPDTDPSRGLIQLPSNIVDASQQITQGCTPRRGQNANRFIATGRGGLPLSPNEPLRGQAVITGWVDLPPQATERVRDKLAVEIPDKKPIVSITKSTNQIVEAQGWIVDANGDIILVAQSGQSSSIKTAISCNQ